MQVIKIDATNSHDNASDDELRKVIYSHTTDISHLEEENHILKQTLTQMRAEFDRMRRPPLMVCEVREIYDKNAMIRVPNGNQFIVEVSADCNDLKPGDDVIVEQKNLNIIRRINSSKRFNVERFVIMEKPTVGWGDIGGLDEQINEIHEVIELPLKSPELFERVGITPPKGILLYGAPGTGKTLLAKAVAASTNSTFIEIVASELVQKFIGEGAKLVNEIFDLAKEKTPSIIFIDELDALAANRIDLGTSGEREVQRTFMQLLAEIDGFKHLGNVKVIGCTNRKDILDPAILRPGRLDRLIYVPIPDARARREIFRIHTSRMTLSRVNVEAMIRRMEEFSGAEIHAACTEAGYFAIRAGRVKVTSSDFVKAIEKVKRMDEEESGYTDMFG